MNTDDHIIDQNGSWSSPQEALEWYRRELCTTTFSRESWKLGMQWAETRLFWFETAFRNVVGVLSDHAAAGNANPAGIDMAALTVSLLGPPDDAPAAVSVVSPAEVGGRTIGLTGSAPCTPSARATSPSPLLILALL